MYPDELNKKYLDTLDLSKYVKGNGYVSDIIDAIQKDYDDSPDLPCYLQGNIFNELDSYEIAEYLSERYNLHIVEEVKFKLIERN